MLDDRKLRVMLEGTRQISSQVLAGRSKCGVERREWRRLRIGSKRKKGGTDGIDCFYTDGADSTIKESAVCC